MRAYLAVTGTLFGLLALLHVVQLVDYVRAPTGDALFLASVGLIVIVTVGLTVWAFRLLRSLRPA